MAEKKKSEPTYEERLGEWDWVIDRLRVEPWAMNHIVTADLSERRRISGCLGMEIGPGAEVLLGVVADTKQKLMDGLNKLKKYFEDPREVYEAKGLAPHIPLADLIREREAHHVRLYVYFDGKAKVPQWINTRNGLLTTEGDSLNRNAIKRLNEQNPPPEPDDERLDP